MSEGNTVEGRERFPIRVRYAREPLNASDERQNDYRRQLQRAYVDHLGLVVNPSIGDKSPVKVSAQRSDAILYAEQHIDKVEAYLQAQPTEGKNGLHYKNLLLRIKKIREKYESGK